MSECDLCGEETKGTTFCKFCDGDWQDDDDWDFDPSEYTELTAADELAFARYQERADFDYWHRGEK